MTSDTAPLLIAIDDEKFYLDELGYELQGHGIEYKPFLGPTVFEQEASEEEINRAKVIAIDYDFRTCTAIDRDLTGYIREKFPQFSGKIVLLSLLDNFMKDNEVIAKSFDGIINKKGFTWEKIACFFN